MKKLLMMMLLQMAAVFCFAQFSVQGVVKSESGELLTGANVVVSGSYLGASTNENGEFEFSNLKKGEYELKASFIGFHTKSIHVSLSENKSVEFVLQTSSIMADEVLVSATRAGDKSPIAHTTVTKEAIDEMNMGQDIPYMLNMTPSYVSTSDAGAGVGYTNFRIRGTDLNRINVTVNGIPMNDAESHGTWWVDIPDIAASTDNIQVQRGVGTSTNGAASFGATIDLQTMQMNTKAHAGYRSAAGSFNTFKNTVEVGSGLLNDHFIVEARLSRVTSDGFIDRASSDLKSYFVSGGYFSDKTILKATIFSGFEETYQAWWGVSSDLLETNRTYNYAGSYFDENGNEQFYENQVDHYIQDHYQLHFSHQLNSFFNVNAALFYTYGRGYYEEYREDDSLEEYLLQPISLGGETIDATDLVRRRWLDNDFYGMTFSTNYNDGVSDFTFGGGWNTYDGRHFGEVIWAQYLGNAVPEQEWYRSTGLKKDFNVFAKYNYQLTEKVNLYADLQYRRIDYEIEGIDNDLRDITQAHDFNFFNPKFGIFFKPDDKQEAYLSFARANREPNRSNYVDADPNGVQPVHETLNDFEAGYTLKSSNYFVGANLYYMSYVDQLILTGEINDVGAPIMVNVDDSYRSGVELMAGLKISPKVNWDVNATFSKNKIKDFVEYVDNWDTWGQEVFELGDTDLAFSPELIANSKITVKASKNLNLSLLSSYVGKQFIDNTSSDDRKLDAWFVNNLKVEYVVPQNVFKEVKLHLLVNNLFDTEYESNAWVYSYFSGNERLKMDGYFPQAGIHFFAGIDFKF